MNHAPDTQASLILRLQRSDDAEAWSEFVERYEPLVYRFARRQGLQDADARELIQRVLLNVAKAVGRWRPDREKGRFRSWLFRIARNELINLVTRQRETGAGGTSRWAALEQLAAPSDVRRQLHLEYRRDLFRLAAARVKRDVQETTWKAFWWTAVEGEPCPRVAAKLGISEGAVYIARSRVLARLRQDVRMMEADDHGL